MNVETILRAKGSAVATVEPDISVRAAAKLLSEKRIGALVVTDKDGRIAGIVSERDLVRVIAADGARALDTRVADLMSRDVVTCGPAETIEAVMAVMTARRIRHLPVVDSGRLAGIVSIGDVVKSRIEETELEARSLRDYVMAGH
ncbi:MAG: CBS domain-containing protein [Alphaproteobacteria bacterium]